MSNYKYSRRRAEVGKVARRLLTIPVMALALLACYVLLRVSPDKSALMADAAPAFAGVPHEGTALFADRVLPLEPQRADDAPVAAYEALDPAGVGRDAAR
jgi:hypothetical protein